MGTEAAEATNKTAAEADKTNTEETKTEETKTEETSTKAKTGKEVYASGLPATYTEDDIRQMFEKFATRGKLINVRFRKHVVGSQTGYAFLTFTNEQDGVDAIKQMNGKNLEQEMIKVTDSASPSYNRSKTNLYIEGLPTNWDEEKVKELFSQFGTITESRVLVNRKTNEKTGVGFIHFKTTEEAKSAIDGLDGSMVDENSEKPLSIRFAKVMGRRRGGGKRFPDNRRRGGHSGGFRGGYGGYGFNPYGGWGGYPYGGGFGHFGPPGNFQQFGGYGAHYRPY